MKKSKRNLVLIITITLIILLLVCVILSLVIKKDNKDDKNINNNEIKKVDVIDKFGYYLEEDATSYYKTLFNDLKKVINEKKIDYEDYAMVLSKLFITDVFTLDNKITSSDIGGLQFIYPLFKDDFIKINQNGLYSSIDSNVYNDRTQELPIVREVNVESISDSIFNYNDKEYDGYEVSLTIDYEKDLGYPTSYKLVLIKENDYLYVAKGE